MPQSVRVDPGWVRDRPPTQPCPDAGWALPLAIRVFADPVAIGAQGLRANTSAPRLATERTTAPLRGSGKSAGQ